MSDADAGPADGPLTTPDVQDLCEEAVAAAHARAYAIIDQAATRSSIDRELLLRSYHYAFDKHSAHRRKSGELYITHPIEVVGILMQLEVDTATMAAGFLHDVIEDCEITKADLTAAFSAEIATLVDGVSKLKLADFERLAPDLAAAAKEKDASKHPAAGAPKKRPHEARSSAENLRKILLAMARDLRVMVIKLADRLHNLKTISGLAPDRQQRMAEETLSVYAPLAARLGIWDLKWQLEDLAFKTLQPLDYKHLTEQIARTRRDREADIAESISTLRTAFDQGTLDVEINGRPKHLWSIYKKMNEQEIPLSDIYDLIALRVIVDSVPECYAALGIVHETYLPIPGKFDDYIAKRKSNGYQSLHTKVYGPRGEPLEVQIRTWEMHKTSEFGIAAHWAYKEKGDGAVAGNNDFERKMAFLRKQLFEWQRDARDTSEFLSQVSTDLFTSQVFVFTPRGDVIDLPTGATPIDFAYTLHTNLGHRCRGARVDGAMVPLNTQLKNGQTVEVTAIKEGGPSRDWLNPELGF
jgi:GTP pyrophosphokinase